MNNIALILLLKSLDVMATSLHLTHRQAHAFRDVLYSCLAMVDIPEESGVSIDSPALDKLMEEFEP